MTRHLTATYLVPVCGVLSAWMFRGDAVSGLALAGGAPNLAGVAFVTRD